MNNDDKGQIIIYQSEDGKTNVEVLLADETVWLTQQQLAGLFQTSRTNVVEHIQHIYEEGELDEKSTCRKFRQVRQEGERTVSRQLTFYNLDLIISLGYRIKSMAATRFRRWATDILKEYLVKGFALDDERLKGNGGGAGIAKVSLLCYFLQLFVRYGSKQVAARCARLHTDKLNQLH